MTAPELETLDGIMPVSESSSAFGELGNVDTPPKRGPGRPKGSRNRPRGDGESVTANGARVSPTPDLAPAARRRGRPKSSASVAALCAGVVGMGNLALSFVSRQDTLVEDEMTLLSKALEQEAMSSERIMRWLTATSPAMAHFALLQAAIVIAMPRLQRRGIIPTRKLTPEEEAAVNEYLRANGAVQEAGAAFTPDSSPAPVRMEAGTASSAGW